MTFEKLFDEYVKSTGFRKLSVRSKQLYMYCGKQLGEYFGAKGVEKIKRSDLLMLRDKRQDRPAHCNLLLRVASVVFSYALDMDFVPHNPAARIKKLKVGSHVKWTPEEVGAIIGLRDRKISTAVALAWYTGQRESDVLAMRWGDYKDGYVRVVQQKTNLEMKIKAHPDLVAYLDGIYASEPDDHYIVSGSTQMNGAAFRNMLKRRTNKLNIDKVFHGIRKGVASAIAENRGSMNEIAAILGHKTIRMAAYYAEQADSKLMTDNAVKSLPSVREPC